jgi:hypothetical protein
MMRIRRSIVAAYSRGMKLIPSSSFSIKYAAGRKHNEAAAIMLPMSWQGYIQQAFYASNTHIIHVFFGDLYTAPLHPIHQQKDSHQNLIFVITTDPYH